MSFNNVRIGQESPFGELGVYSLTNVFSYQPSWGISLLRDITDVTSTGTITTEGSITSSTGTTTGSHVNIFTAERGEYQPGKACEAGIGATLDSTPTGDSFVELGLKDSRNGMFYRIKSDGLNAVIFNAGSETLINQTNFNIDKLDGNGPSGVTYDSTDSYIYGIRFSWYGVGTIGYVVWVPSSDTKKGMKEILLHLYVPTVFPSIEDPNLPIVTNVDNGSTTQDLVLRIGGRRYDILGDFKPDSRKSGAYRTGQSVGTSMIPTIAVRKKDPFPTGTSRENSVNSFIETFEVYSQTEDILVWVYTVEEGELTSGSWGVPTYLTDDETSLEFNTSETVALSSASDYLAGPFLVKASEPGSKSSSFDTEKGLRVPIINTRPTAIVAQSLSGTATVLTIMRMIEQW